MQRKVFNLDVPLKGKYEEREKIVVFRDDYLGNEFKITLWDVDEYGRLSIYPMQPTYKARVTFVKSDNTVVVQDSGDDDGGDITIASNVITVVLRQNSIAALGMVRMDIQVYENEPIITSVPVRFRVDKSLLNDEAVESFSELPKLSVALNNAQNLSNQIEQAEAGRVAGEGLRNSQYITSEQNRDIQYSQAEANRGIAYTNAEQERDNSYANTEQARNDLYDTAEQNRDNLYDTAEQNRDGQYSQAEIDRGGLYDTAEAARNTAYGARVTAVENDLESHKSDYASYTKRLRAIDQFGIFGVIWDKSSNSTLIRTDYNIGAIVNIGIDNQEVQNDFDITQIWGEFKEVTDSYGNVFIRIPKCYIKKTDAVDLKTWQVSKTKYKGFYLPWCFWDFTNNKELDYVDVGKYKASLGAGDKLESKPNTYPLINKTIVNFRTYAQNNNINGLKGYQQLDIHVVDLLQTLFIIEQATLDSQSKINGYTAGQYTATHLAVIAEENTNRIIVPNATANLYEVGQAISIGTSQGGNQIFYGRTITAIEVYDANNKAVVFDGAPVNIAVGNYLYNTGYKNDFSANIASSVGSVYSNTSGKHPFVWHGIESLYGDVWQFVDGININENQSWVCKNADSYSSNLFTAPYEKLSYINSNANGYAKAMGFDSNLPFAEFPVDITGGLTTHYSDYYDQAAGQRIARFGGGWYYWSSAGLFRWYLINVSSDATVTIGGRLLKKPL